ncbi:MAG: AAA family ATPase [Anaerolineae bacterium]
MCYRAEQTLDFSGIHLACLAGDNGHGKSALLDAMTWALWGKARARRDDELITLGESEMWVELEFELSGQRYRVWRQRSKKGRGQSDLHFYVWNPPLGMAAQAGHMPDPPAGSRPDNTGEWQLLDEGGLLDRQEQIIRTLGLDYETFVNSAFLLQGKADAFTVKTPSERKQILADILGLARYDLYEQRARDEAQARKERAIRLEGEIRGLEEELARRGEYEARLAAARAATEAAEVKRKAAEAVLFNARLAVQARQAQARHLDDLRQRLTRAERDLAELKTQWEVARSRLAQFQAMIARRAEIEAGWEALQRARAADAAWNERLQRHTALVEAAGRVRLAIQQERATLEAMLRRLEERYADLAREVASGRRQEELLAEVQAVLAKMAGQQARREEIGRELRANAERDAVLTAAQEQIKAEGQAIGEKIELLSRAGEAVCPLCAQPLTPEHRARVLADLTARRDTLADLYRAHTGELKGLRKRRAELEREDMMLQGELRSWDARQREAMQAEMALNRARAAAEEQSHVEQQIEELRARLAARDYAPDEQAELGRIETQIAEVGYDAAAHRAVQEEIGRLQSFDFQYQRQLLPALEGVEEAHQQVAALAAQLARRDAELAEDRAEVERLHAQLADLPQLEAALKHAEAEVERAGSAEERARLEEGAARQQLAALDVLATRRAQRVAELEAVNLEIGIYSQLREAFGKKGLQAMIIESAIPEVESEANRLLARMSEGRMSLRLETQREKVTGGVAETLDIIISDELGARPYEMYSGGEAFRANLALRIAISKLLARRAGARLQTLIIDEGFGSQDARGRSLVVEAINSIQDDFQRIIVITHIEELRDLFPARIDVVKTAYGSRVSII